LKTLSFFGGCKTWPKKCKSNKKVAKHKYVCTNDKGSTASQGVHYLWRSQPLFWFLHPDENFFALKIKIKIITESLWGGSWGWCDGRGHFWDPGRCENIFGTIFFLSFLNPLENHSWHVEDNNQLGNLGDLRSVEP